MELGGRVTRSLRRRLNSVDLDINSNGRSTPISELDILIEDTITTPNRRGRKQATDTPEKTPLNRRTRRRSVTESPAFLGTPLRKTRRNSTSCVELENETIDSTKKNLRKSVITEIVSEENEKTGEFNTNEEGEKSAEKKKRNLMVKIPKLKTYDISPNKNIDFELNKTENKENNETITEEATDKNKNNGSPKTRLKLDEDATITKERTSPFSMTLRKNRLSPNQHISIREKNGLEEKTSQSFQEIENNNMKESSFKVESEIKNSPRSNSIQSFDSKINLEESKNVKVFLNQTEVNNQSVVVLTDDENEIVPASQFVTINESNYKTKRASVLNESKSENCEINLNENELYFTKELSTSKCSKKNLSLKNLSDKEKFTENISNLLNTEEFKNNDEGKPEDKLSNSDIQELTEANETETKLKSVTFNDGESYSEKETSRFPKTPITNKIKTSVGIEECESPTKLNSSKKIDTEKISHFDRSKMLISDTPNKVATTNINASSTPLNENVDGSNLKKKSGQLLISKQQGNKGDLFSKSWTQSVRRSTSVKIDTLSLSMQEDKQIDSLSTSKTNEYKKKYNSEDHESNTDEENSDEQNEKSNEFIDNEAEEVEDEDSMEEEERQYLKENEIVERGISLGSEDTDHSNNESSEEDNSFIVSDNEEDKDIFSSDEEVSMNSSDNKLNTTSKLKKKYNRIEDSSSDNEEEESIEKNENRKETLLNSTRNETKFENKIQETKTNKENMEVNSNPDDAEVEQLKLVNSHREIEQKLNSENELNNSKSQNVSKTNDFNVSNISLSSKKQKKSLNSISISINNENDINKNNDPGMNLDEGEGRLNKSDEKVSFEPKLSKKDKSLSVVSGIFSNSSNQPQNESSSQLSNSFKQENERDPLNLEVSKFIDQSSSEEDKENSINASKINQSQKKTGFKETSINVLCEETDSDEGEKTNETKGKFYKLLVKESSMKIVYDESNSENEGIDKNNAEKNEIKENNIGKNLNHSKNYSNLSKKIFTVSDSYNEEEDKDFVPEETDGEDSSDLTKYNSDISKEYIPNSLSFTSSLHSKIVKENSKTSLSFTEGFSNKNMKYCSSSDSDDITTNNCSISETENEYKKSNIEKKELKIESPTNVQVCDTENKSLYDVRTGENIQNLKNNKNIASNELKENIISNINNKENMTCLNNKPEESESRKITNYNYILKRCNEILNAANEAKLKQKLNKRNENLKSSKKSGVLGNSENTGRIEKLKHKKAVSKAVICAQTILNKNTKNTSTERKSKIEDKLLPIEVIDAISNNSQSLKKTNSESKRIKSKQNYKMETECHYNLENISSASSSLISTSSGIFVEEPVTPKKRKISKIELATGTVLEEPITPVTSQKRNGFMESPVTPIGFKVRRIISAGQKDIPELKTKKHKRKFIDEPVNVLSQRVWTSSGDFIEEVYKPLNTNEKNVTTEFYAVPLKTKKFKSNQYGCGIINKNALEFKKNALSSTKNYRETSKQLLQRKERQKFYNK